MTHIDYLDILATEIDYVEYCKKYLRKNIYENQVETVNAICDPNVRKVVAIHARQTGKTDSVAMACINIGERNSATTFGNILIFGPREGQAMLDLARIKTLTQFNEHYADLIDWPSSTKTAVIFKDKQTSKFSREPGIVIKAFSAAETANIEGESSGLIILEEAQKVSDKVVSEAILPMGGAWGAKIVKIGTPRRRNHFYMSYKDPFYSKCIFPWEKCGILKAYGTINIDGQEVSTYVLDRMPKIIKQEYWPDNPTIDYGGHVMNVWDIPGDMIPDDFRTQYKLDWLVDVDLFFNEDEINYMYGDHVTIDYGIAGEQYFAGFDPAGGSLTDSSDDSKNDASALTILRKYPNGKKEIVYKDERYGEDYANQIEWIKDLCDARSGRFSCQAVFIDATGCGMPVVDVLRHAMPRTSIIGVMFSRSEPESGKNWKNAMFDHIKMEVASGMFKYPRYDVVQHHQLMSKHITEWSELESKRTTGVNKIIRAPGDGHDDGPCSDVLAAYVADRLPHVRKILKQGIGGRATVPVLVDGVSSRPIIMNQGF